MMETSAKAAEVLVNPKPDAMSSSPDADSAEAEAAAPPAASDFFDPMEEFSRRLETIISTHGSAAGLPDKQSVEAEVEKMKEEAKDDITVTMEKEVSVIMQSLSKLSSPEKKLEDLVRKYAEMAVLRRCDEKKLCVQQQKLSVLLEERQQLQAECRSGVVARSELENLCRELQEYYSVLREETLQRSKEDEKKRSEITCHFQNTLTEIQAQIEHQSTRNTKLCHENTTLTEKLESLMHQCEMREKSLEKINKHRDLQCQLNEAKLKQANALLVDAEEKHKREKEYLLREAIDKTKKYTAMKEQELAMKKQLLVQAAEWKLQAQALKEQETVMQAQLTLYSQKFEEFQETLAKSNQIFVRFKKEMDNMTEKMKKLEKESNVWKTRFENCNKALTDMIEERTEKNKEYDLFVLKIQKLEKLCRALQDERKVLYDKIKEVRHVNSSLPLKIFTSSNLNEIPNTEGADKSVLTSVELQELQEEDLVVTEEMTRLKEEQAKLQEFAASLLATPINDDEEENEDLDLEEDIVASAFVQFKTKPQVKEQAEDVKSGAAESVPPQPDIAEEAQKPDTPTAEEKTSETTPTPTDPKPEAVKDESQVEVKPDEEIQQQHSEVTPDPEKVQIDPPTDQKPEAEILVEAGEVEPAAPEEGQTAQQQPAEPVQVTEEAPTKSEPAPVSEDTPQTTAVASNANSSKKQAPKKKKKKNGKNAS